MSIKRSESWEQMMMRKSLEMPWKTSTKGGLKRLGRPRGVRSVSAASMCIGCKKNPALEHTLQHFRFLHQPCNQQGLQSSRLSHPIWRLNVFHFQAHCRRPFEASLARFRQSTQTFQSLTTILRRTPNATTDASASFPPSVHSKICRRCRRRGKRWWPGHHFRRAGHKGSGCGLDNTVDRW